MLKDILDFRRAVRYYAPTPISEEKVRECLKLATLAPTTYNMQLYEVYHITPIRNYSKSWDTLALTSKQLLQHSKW